MTAGDPLQIRYRFAIGGGFDVTTSTLTGPDGRSVVLSGKNLAYARALLLLAGDVVPRYILDGDATDNVINVGTGRLRKKVKDETGLENFVKAIDGHGHTLGIDLLPPEEGDIVTASVFYFANCVYDPMGRRLVGPQKARQLPEIPARILGCLLQNAPGAVDLDTLHEASASAGRVGTTSSQICHARAILEDVGSRVTIEKTRPKTFAIQTPVRQGSKFPASYW